MFHDNMEKMCVLDPHLSCISWEERLDIKLLQVIKCIIQPIGIKILRCLAQIALDFQSTFRPQLFR